jgi:hypothetical protein
MRYTPLVAAMALAVLAACGGNKDNTGQPGGTTTDTASGAMSSPNSQPAPSTTPAPGATTPDTSHAMQPSSATPMPDSSGMKKSTHKRHKADTTAH